MAREGFSDLLALIAVAQTGSFTRAAAQLGVTQPALSASIRGLEERLGVRVLLRSTRRVTLTMAGQHLVDRIVPEFEYIEKELASLNDLRDKPTGTLRITAIDYAIRQVLWPKLSPFLQQYPDITVELISEYASVDIAARGYDAGVRFGTELAQDMISVRIGPDVKNTVVGSANYFTHYPPPSGLTLSASTGAFGYAPPPMAASTTGSLPTVSASSPSGSTARSSVITPTTFLRPRKRGWVLPTCHRIWFSPCWIQASWCRYSKPGARCGRACISITLTGASIPGR